MAKKRSVRTPKIAIIMGSDSDYKVMKDAEEIIQDFGVKVVSKVVSAHRTPKEMYEFSEQALESGIQVIIAGAGGAAHLPGMVASLTDLPVIGVPIALKELKGVDSLLSIVQMPKGVPVATVAINNAYNAGLLALKILACGGDQTNPQLIKKLSQYRQSLRKKVLRKKL